ncbi:MAG: dihydroorotate oxidase electron transfer subunit, partial [Pseudonocardia sp.]|nr:dihydroorotate oxidase electron transfer subunit [Pseudonocardia sp.]
MSLTPLAGLAPDRPSPTWRRARVLENRRHADRYWRLRLAAPEIASSARAGQFVMLTAAREDAAGPLLPRPMAIYAADAARGTVDVMYGVVGAGTRALTSFVPGERMVVVGPLGQGFVLAEGTRRVLLLGRGIGVCSLTCIAHEDVEVVAVVSARTPAAVLGAEVFGEGGAVAFWPVTDAEGTSDVGALRALLPAELDGRPPQQILTCGSERLARLAAELGGRWRASVQVCLEAHMACGLGYCHGCATGTGG